MFPENHIKYCINVTQPQINLINQFDHDRVLQAYLKGTLTENQYRYVQDELQSFGQLCVTELHKWAVEAERVKPTLIQQDVYGQRVSQVIVGEGWKKQKEYASREGVVAKAYEKDEVLHDMQRFIQLVKLSMYQPSGGLYGCPLAMTDGAAFLLQQWLKHPTTDDQDTNKFVRESFMRLTSRDQQLFWTSGQWMTEKKGGSDVSNATETIALHLHNNKYKLYGYKWFSSATDSDIAITLARIVVDNSNTLSQIPLSLFIVRVRDDKGDLNNIQIQSLKDKLGTRQLPTGELLLNGVEAYLISIPGRGVSGISHMLNVTRLYNASSAVGGMRKMYQIVLDYSYKRKAFNRYLIDLPAHQTLLTQFELHVRANTLFYLKMSTLFSRMQFGSATKDEESLFRLMIPLLKMYTAKRSVQWMSEGIEALGALGYMENSNVPVMLRDAQVLTIWEGTTTVLCLDFVRALQVKDSKDPLFMINVYSRHHSNLMMDFVCSESKVTDRKVDFTHQLSKLTNNHNSLITKLSRIVTKQYQPEHHERRIRSLAMMFAENFIALQMIDMILKNGRQSDVLAFELWVEQMESYTTDSLISDSNSFKQMVSQDVDKLRSTNNRPKL